VTSIYIALVFLSRFSSSGSSVFGALLQQNGAFRRSAEGFMQRRRTDDTVFCYTPGVVKTANL